MDRSLTKVVSANGGTGDYLAIQVNKPASENPQVYSNIKVTLFHGSTGTTLYTPEGHDDVHADPSGAISADWVTFAVTRLRVSSFTYKVMLYDRGAGVTRTLVESHQQTPQGKRLRGSPVIADGKVYWLASISNRPETTTLESWDLAQNSAAGSVPAAGATGLVSYGSGVALINEEASQATLSNGAGAPLARSQLVSARGSHFGFDGRSKLTWLRRENGSIRYFYLVVGGTSVSNLRLHTEVPASDLPLPTYPFLATEANSQYSLFDMRARGGISLPKGVSLQAVVGDKVIFGTGTTPAGAAGLSVVRLSASPPAGC